jgi:hypothetical protein
MTPEEEAREVVDGLLQEAGWRFRDCGNPNPNAVGQMRGNILGRYANATRGN